MRSSLSKLTNAMRVEMRNLQIPYLLKKKKKAPKAK